MPTPTKKAPAKKSGPTPKRSPRAAAKQPTEDLLTEEDLLKLREELESDDGPIGPDGEIRPVEIGKSGRVGVEMVHIFSIDDEKFFIPKDPNPAVMIQFMRELRDKRIGRDQAVENALLTVLGPGPLEALAASPQTSPEDVAKVFVVAAHIFFGALAKMRKAADPS